MSELYDVEFGEVVIKTIASSRHVKVRINSSGQLTATIPNRFALNTLKRLIDESRDELRPILKKIRDAQPEAYIHRQKIGASHVLILNPSDVKTIRSRLKGSEAIVTYPSRLDGANPSVQQAAQAIIRRALKLQAESYLPRQLQYLADTHGYSFRSVTFGNAQGRWGSCTSNKVIRLNIALMKLPMGLIDYVLIHELAHTRELNHSSRFWDLVEAAYPHYKSSRKQLKQFSPYI